MDINLKKQMASMKNILKKNQKLSNNSKVLDKDFLNKRKEVLVILYQAKKLYPNAPRTEIKITTKDGGLGWTNHANFIAIGIETPQNALVHIVLHELVHTWFKHKGHNEKCPLMKPFYNENGESEEVAWNKFKEYAQNYLKQNDEIFSCVS